MGLLNSLMLLFCSSQPHRPRLRSRLADWGCRRVERSEARIRAAEAAEIAANADRIDRLRQAALIGSATAAAALIDIAADRVGQARRSAALAAITRLREQNVIK
jgi:hypothetical protein